MATLIFDPNNPVVAGTVDADTIVFNDLPPPGSSIDGGDGIDTLQLHSDPLAPLTFSWIRLTVTGTTNFNFANSTVSSIERIDFRSDASTAVAALFGFGGTVPDQIGAGLSETTELVGGDGADSLSLAAGTTAGNAYTFTVPTFTCTNWFTPARPYLSGDTVNLFVFGGGDITVNASPHLGVQYIGTGDGDDTVNGSADMDRINAGGGVNTIHAGAGSDGLIISNSISNDGSGNPQAATTFTGAGSLFDGGTGTDFLMVGGNVAFAGTLLSIEGIYLMPAYTNTGPNAISQVATELTISGAIWATLPSGLVLDGEGTITVNLEPGQVVDTSGYVYEPVSDVELIFVPSGGETPVAVGGEFLANSLVVGTQHYSSLAALSGGGFVVTWQSQGQDGSGYGVFAQLFHSDGSLDGGEFLVNTETVNSQDFSVVAALVDGGFVIVWISDGQDGDGHGIFGQRYNADGTADGSEFQVNSTSANHQWFPTVRELADGGFVVAWESSNQDGDGWGIFAQRYDASGNPSGGEFQVNTTTTSWQRWPSITSFSDGSFLFTWSHDDLGWDIYGQRYDVSGAQVGGEFLINTTTNAYQLRSSGVELADGSFVVIWYGDLQDGDAYGIFGQRFLADGTPVGAEFQINTTTADWQEEPSITALSDGGFLVVWQSNNQDGDQHGIFGQRFDANGNKLGDEFVVNETVAGDQILPYHAHSSVDQLDDGSVVVTWSGNGTGDSSGVFVRIFESPSANTVPFLDNQLADQSSDEDTPVAFQLPADAFSDPDGDALTYSAALANGDPLPAWLAFDAATRSFSCTPPQDFNGSFDIEITASDGQYATSDTFILTIDPVNDAPVPDLNGLDPGTDVQLTYAINQAPVFVAPDGLVTDVDSADFNGGLWNINIIDGGGLLEFVSAGDGPGQVRFTATEAFYQGVLIGTTFGPSGISLRVFFNGNSTPEAAQAVLRSVNYSNDSENPPESARVQFLLGDGDPDLSGAVTSSISYADIAIENLNEPPVAADDFGAFEPVALGGEFQVNTGTAGDQRFPAVAHLEGGGFVVTWGSLSADGLDSEIYAQRYDGNGNAVGGEFRVNTEVVNYQTESSVAALAGGGFVVTWSSFTQDSSGWGVYGQRFDATGNPVGGEFRTNSHTANNQEQSSVRSLADGGFVVTWMSLNQDGSEWGIYGQRYDAAGNATGGEFRVNTTINSNQFQPSAASLANGGFVLSWASQVQDGSGWGIYAQRYDAAGNPVGTEFRANSHTFNDQQRAEVIGLAGGGFVIAWDSNNQDPSGDTGVYAQVYAADGSTVGGEFRVNATFAGTQVKLELTGLADGGFMATWMSFGQDGDNWGIYGQRYDASGNPVGGEFLVNSTTAGEQGYQNLATLPDGSVVVVWHSDGQDGDGLGIFAQRFALGYATDEDTPLVIDEADLLANDFDIDGDALSISGVSATSTQGASVTLNPDGTITYDPTASASLNALAVDQNAADTFTYTANDGNGGTGTATVHLTVDGRNDAPGPESIFLGIGLTEGTGTASVNMLVNTSDVDNGAVLSVTNVTGLQQGITWSGDRLHFDTNDPAFDYLSQGEIQGFTVDYDIVDEHGASVSRSYLFNVIGTNDAPVVVPRPPLGLTNEDAGIWASNLLSNASDPEGDDLDLANVTLVSSNAARSLAFTVDTGTGDFSFDLGQFNDLALGESEVATIEYDVVDGNGGVTPAIITLLVEGRNDAPVAADDFGAFEPAPVGGEVQVNSYTAADQSDPAIAALADGGYVVVWQSVGQDGSDEGVYAQRYDADGNAAGGEFLVNTHTVDAQTESSVASLAGGGFVVTWTSLNQDGSSNGIYGQRYDATGSPVGGEFRANSYTANRQELSSVTGLADGGFVVTWISLEQDGSGWGIYGQRYDAAGNAAGTELRVHTAGQHDQFEPSVAMLADGGFVVAWASWSHDGSGWGVFAQRYDADGNAVGGNFVANSHTFNDQQRAEVIGLARGGFVIAWDSNNQDPSGDTGVYAQVYAADGSTVGGEFRVNATFAGTQVKPELTGLTDGGFMATWMSFGQDGDNWGIYGQRYDASGNPVGGEFLVNSTTAGEQGYQNLATLPDGSVVVVWHSDGQDGDGIGIFAQRLALGFPTDEDTALVIDEADLLANDFDLDGDALTISGVSATSAQGASVTLNPDGTITYDPTTSASLNALAVGETSTDSFEYTVSDGNGGTGTATVNLTIDGRNDAPVVAQSPIVRYSWSDFIDATPFGLSASEPITITVEYNRNAATSGGDGVTKLAYAPVQYTISLGGEEVSRTGDISIFNGTPSGDLITIAATAQFGLTLHGLRFGGFGHSFIDRSGALLGDLSLPAVPDLFDELTSQQFVLTLNDPADGQNISVFEFGSHFELVDLTPPAILDVASPEDAPVSLVVPEDAFIDPDGDPLTFSATLANGDPLPPWLSFDGATRRFSGTPPQDFNGSFDIEVTASDGSLYATDTFTLTIDPVNDAPVAQPDTASTVEDDPVITGNVGDNDSDVDNSAQLSYAVDGAPPAGFTLSLDGSWSFDPSDPAYQYLGTGQSADVVVDYTVSDEHGASSTATLTIEVAGVNDAPEVIGNPVQQFLPDSDVYTTPAAGILPGGMAIENLPDGGYVVAWTSSIGNDGDSNVLLQIFDADGLPTGDPFSVAPPGTVVTNGQNNRSNPDIELLDNGTFAVVWQQNSTGTNGPGIYARVFEANGTPAGDEFVAFAYGTGFVNGGDPQVIDAGGGKFWVFEGTTQGSGRAIYAQRVDSEGSLIGGRVLVSNPVTSSDPVSQNFPEVIALENGDIVVAWSRFEGIGVPNPVEYQVFSSDLTPITGVLVADDSLTRATIWIRLAPLAGGGFVMAWEAPGAESRYQIFGEDNLPIGPVLSLGNDSAANSQHTAITSLDDGTFIVAWKVGPDDQAAVAQRFAADGTRIGPEFVVNPAGAGPPQYMTLIALDGDSVAVTFSGPRSQIFSLGIVGGGSQTVEVDEGDPVETGQLVAEDVDDGAVLTFTLDAPIAGLSLAADGSWSFDPSDPTYESLNPGEVQQISAGYTVTDEFGASAYGTLLIAVTGTNDAPVAADDFGSSGPVPLGGEVQVNSTTAGDQRFPSITHLEGGGYVVTWGSLSEDGSGWNIVAQRYDADGNLAGGEFQVNTHAPEAQTESSTSALAGGGFIVTWTSLNQDGSSYGVFGQRFDADGNLVGSEFQVNSFISNTQEQSSVTGLGGGGFVVTWMSLNQDGSGWGVYGQRYDSAGAPAGTEFRINLTASSHQVQPSVAALADGGFVASWASFAQDRSGYGIIAQRYDADGNVVGSDFLANSHTFNDQQRATVTGLAGGGFVIAWDSNNQDPTGDTGVYAQLYAADGTRVGSEFRANTTFAGTQLAPAVTSLADGGFTVTWTSHGQDGSGAGIFGQRYDASGNAIGAEFQVNSFTSGAQDFSGVAGLPDGSFVVAWQSADQDGSGQGVYAQRFALGFPTDEDTAITLDGTQLLANDSDPDGDALTIAGVSATSSQGAAVTLHPDGSVSYDPTASAALNALAVGESIIDSFTYTLDDGNGGTDTATVNLTVEGRNDAPVIDEGGSDLASSLSTGFVRSGSYDAAALFANTDLVADGISYALTEIGGVEVLQVSTDAAVLGGRMPFFDETIIATGELGENSRLTVTVSGEVLRTSGDQDQLFGIRDDDSFMGFFVSDNVDSDFLQGGTFLASGEFTVDTADRLMIANISLHSFTLRAVSEGDADEIILVSGDGQAYGQTLALGGFLDNADALRLILANDQTETNYYVSLSYEAVAEGLLDNGRILFDDVDLSDTRSVEIAGVSFTGDANGLDEAGARALLSLSLDQPGKAIDWSFAADDADFAYLGAGQNLEIAYEVTVSDGNGGTDTETITITIADRNDSPVASAVSASADEDGPTTLGQLIATDVDEGALLSYTLDAPVAGLTVNADGSWIFDPSEPTYQYLAVGETLDIVANYAVTDEHGASDGSTLTVILTGINDEPEAEDDVTEVDEDGSVTGNVISGVTDSVGIADNAPDHDVDASDVLTVTDVAGNAPGIGTTGAYGTLILNPDGSYAYDADADILDVLAPGTAGIVENFDYTISDGNGGSSTASLTFNITILDDGIVVDTSEDPNSGNGSASITGTDGDDLLNSSRGNDTVSGGEGGDRIYGGKGDDYLDGGPGIDFIDGGNGKDTLLGGPGDDILLGGKGDDQMYGNDGSDIFISDQLGKSRETDTIMDFEVGIDFLFLVDGLSITGMQEKAGATEVALSNGAEIVLEGVLGLNGDSSLLMTDQLPAWV